MHLSKFGQKFCAESATVSLMDDLGEALTVNPDLLFMGGGNPARIPAAEAIFQNALHHVLRDEEKVHRMLGVYQSPQGDPEFLEGIALLLSNQFGWKLSARNIAVANGSQSAFSVLFNLFAGEYSNNGFKRVQLPLVPEYVGYEDVGFSEDFFRASRPSIEYLDEHSFKYRVDFDQFSVAADAGLICISRPTNPTGNVLTDREVEQLASLAEQKDIPFIVDGAYGTPFPNIIFTEAKPYWSPNTILVLSLSKLGLPGARTGIVVADEDVIQAFTRANTILALACGNLGPAIAKEMLRDNEVLRLGSEIIRPFYREAVQRAMEWIHQDLAGLPYRIHKAEGAIFLWLWFEGLPITSRELYERLKQRGVLILPGESFFVGLQEDWPHRRECIRLTYSQDPGVVRQGIAILAEEVRKAYG
ncbi:valine--pyruvate transaminase [Gilvimarinus sp. F26214L]|uniref:valine--pyruvate transaminase n=1 Tax=Gilvimarinus sp. DZF01 TaxID=3461371 RepID=UPI0040459F1A